MTLLPIFKDLVSTTLSIDNIYLDPNNPRFTELNWDYVNDDDIDNPTVQEKAQRILLDKYAIDKLRSNMEVNGYLPIDRVIVRQFKTEKYVVLEGNRRICAAKLIHLSSTSSTLLLPDVLGSFKEIPCLLYTGTDTDAAWIFQGIRHISGVIDWSAFNKAKLLYEQMEKEGLNLTEVGKRFGLTPHGAGQWVRGYLAFKQARERSDYIYEVDERSYPYFQEVFSKSSVNFRDWMGWVDDEKVFKKELEFNEFVGWLYPKLDDEEGATESKGDWNRRVIKTRDDIRTLSYLIREAPDLFEQFRNGKNIEGTLSIALVRKYEKQAKEQSNPIEEVFEALKICTRTLENLPFKMLRDEEIRGRLFIELENLEDKIKVIKS